MKNEKGDTIITGCEFYENGWTCNKAPEWPHSYCPHHLLRMQEGQTALNQRMEKVRLRANAEAKP